MKFSLVSGERVEAEKGLLGTCIGCGQLTIPKCGEKNVKHWAHKSKCQCDPWWENETEWHRNWKNNFPREYQEVRHKDDVTGEWHIADVKTEQGYILEFQHSFLKSDERNSRNNFYGKYLIWVVDGLKRKKDKSKLDQFLSYAMPIGKDSPILKLHPFLDECSIIEEWSECIGPVFFDFGSNESLWCLLPKSSKENYYMIEYSKLNLVEILKGNLNSKKFSDLIDFVNLSIVTFEHPELIEAVKRNHAANVTPPPVQNQFVARSNTSLNNLLFLERVIAGAPQLRHNKYRKFRRK